MTDSQTYESKVVLDRLDRLIVDATGQVEDFEAELREVGTNDGPVNAFDVAETAGNLAYRKAFLVTLASFAADVRTGQHLDVSYSRGLTHACNAGLPQTINPMEVAVRHRQQQGILAGLREIHDTVRRVRRELERRDDS